MEAKRKISTWTLLGNWKKKLWNMKVTVIPIVIVVLGTATKRLIPGIKELEIRGRVKTMKSKAFIRSARISRKVLKTWGDLLSRRLKRKTTRSENSQMSKIIIIPARRPDLIIINKKKRTCKIVDFAVPADHWKNVKRRISTSTLLGKWKNGGTCRWQLCQL